ncbi:hypothetical protein B0I37DRAFT_175986 [Chaetomium sp. MPI-CAGE-AT-0009]|nr:hypothetical protein B0I37DRAFT_175986 [Chaetomium sp. MPI-CAGE-AT-0009]
METLEKLLDSDTVEDMRSSWLAIPQENREAKKWLAIMKAAMDFRFERTAMLLAATVETDLTPSWAVADVFSALATWRAKLPKDSQQGKQTQLPQLLLHLLHNSSPRHYRFQQFALGLTLSACKPDEVAEIYSALQARNHPLHWNTKLKIAGYLTKKTKHKLAALRLFESLFDDPNADIHGRRCAALATELFALPEDWEDRRSPIEVQLLAEAFERVISRGLSPNIVTYTAMIRALCVTNQLDAAWQIYEVMRNSGITPDPHVFSILLNGAKRALSLDSAIRVMREATPDALQAPYIWNDLVHTILLAAVEELPSASAGNNPITLSAYPSMLRAYSKFFDLKPLQKLIPAGSPDPADAISDWTWKEKLDPVIDQLPVSPPDRLVEPGLDTLGIMLTGYIKSLPSTEPVMSFYSHFRNLLYHRDPLAIRLVRHSTLPYDLVIGAIANRPGMLRAAIDIVWRMLGDAIRSAEARKRGLTESDPGQPDQNNDPEEPFIPTLPAFYHPAPSVYTWTILVQAFCWQLGPKKSLTMIRSMRHHGVEPNHITWHALLNAYARRQQAAPVLAVLDQLDEAGYPPNRHTIRAVGKLHNHEAILTRLDERAALRDKSLWAEVEAAAAPSPPRHPPLSSRGRGLIRMARVLRKRRRMVGRSAVPWRLAKLIRRRLSEWRAMQTEPPYLEPLIPPPPGKTEPWREEEPWKEQLWEKESQNKEPQVEELKGRAGAVRKEEPAKQRASDTQLDSYLRMYDELVFMRMAEEKDSVREQFVPRQPGDGRRSRVKGRGEDR